MERELKWEKNASVISFCYEFQAYHSRAREQEICQIWTVLNVLVTVQGTVTVLFCLK